MRLRYVWQLTVLITDAQRGGVRLIQWPGHSTGVPESMTEDELRESVYLSWLDTPEGRAYGNRDREHVTFFAVRMPS